MTSPTPHDHHRNRGLFGQLRNNFLTGLIVVAPIGLTLWLMWTVAGWVDSWVWPFVPSSWHPEALVNQWLGGNPDPEAPGHIAVNVRGFGVVLFLVFTILVGWIAKGLIGRSFLRFGENLVNRMPVVRSIYSGLKQIAETVLSQSDSNFDKACLIEHPRQGVYAIAFISTKAKGEIAKKLGPDNDFVTVFMPTTPNPTSGFLLYLRRNEIIELDMTVEDAAKLIISAGLVYPGNKDEVEKMAEKSVKKS